MPISQAQIRDLLLPGLWVVSGRYHDPILWRDSDFWDEPKSGSALVTPHIWIPKPLPLIAGMGLAAAVVENPVVTRRFWTGWLKP